jgi:FMN reductase
MPAEGALQGSVDVVVVVGNPKPRSRTYQAACLVAERLTGAPPDLVVDLVDLGPSLLDWSDASVAAAVAVLQSASVIVVASPTYKGSYTGLLKLFLDRIGGGALRGVLAVAMMLGGDLRHGLAPEVFLKPVLNELGASCPTPGLFLLESDYAGSPALDDWLERARPALAGAVPTAGGPHTT